MGKFTARMCKWGIDTIYAQKSKKIEDGFWTECYNMSKKRREDVSTDSLQMKCNI